MPSASHIPPKNIMPIPTAVTILPILFNVLTSPLPSFQVATFQMLPCQTISDCFSLESLSMRNSVLFCGKHKADNPAGSPSFQVLLLSLQVLDNSCNHLPLYRNPDHTLHQFNMLRFTHSFSSPFFYSSLVVQSPYRTLPRPST